MKRPSSSDSLRGASPPPEGLISVYPSHPEEKKVAHRVGSFQSILDGYAEEEDEMMVADGEDTSSQGAAAWAGSGEKKRRLSIEQVKALEKNFEVENKLDPDRKVKLAQELGLQPRQVAVWFQNRRARWKTKQLERDYGVLKASYEALKLNHDTLQVDNEALRGEIKALKAKLSGNADSSHGSIKEEPVEATQVEVKPKEEVKAGAEEVIVGAVEEEEEEGQTAAAAALIYKDGSSDSDSSAILNDDESSPLHIEGAGLSSPSGAMSKECHQLQEEQQRNDDLFHGFSCTSSSSPPPFHYQDGRGGSTRLGFPFYFQSQTHLWKAEENGLFNGEDPCSSSFFSDDQPPTLSWYCSDQWD